MLVSLTVGKVDAGVTVLLTEDKRLIEFPSILLPPDIASGSIVDINVGRNDVKEHYAEQHFRALQDQMYSAFGTSEPQKPVLRCRNATQTSVVLEWDSIQPATADILSLVLFRNGQKAGGIPRPTVTQSTKISGLAVDTEYSFHLVLRTTAGTLASDKVVVRTHKMTDLSGITITTGILTQSTRERLVKAVERIGARLVDGVRIDTTHFVTTEGRGVMWEKANEQNIPVVRPEWVEVCEKTGRILGVTKFYLTATSPTSPAADNSTSTGPPPTDAAPAPMTTSDKGVPDAPCLQEGSGAEEDAKTDQEKKMKAEEEAADTAATQKSSDKDEDHALDNIQNFSLGSGAKSDRNKPGRLGGAGQEEEKALAEDRRHQQANLAMRPKPLTIEEADKQGAKSPGDDSASFQDVSL